MSDQDTVAGDGQDTTGGGGEGDGKGNGDGLSIIDNALGGDAKTFDFSKGERPQDFPEDLWNADKKAPDVDKLFSKMTEAEKRAEGLRKKLSKGETGNAPEKAEDYTFVTAETTDEEKAVFEAIPADDPLLKVARDSAKAAGLSQETYIKVFAPLAKTIAGMKDVVSAEPTAEEKAAYIKAETAKLGKGGDKIIGGLAAWKKEQVAAGLMSAADQRAFSELTETADGVRFMNRMIQRMGAQVVPHDVDVDEAASTADLEKKMSEAFKAGNEADYNKYKAQVLQRKGG